MLTKHLIPFATFAVMAAPACADYTFAPFHDRPLDVARLAFAVLDGDSVPVPTDDIPLAAAVASFLLVSELGLAEAFEEAVGGQDDDEDDEEDAGEGDGYDVAYAMLQRIKPWLAAVPENAETRDLIARLDTLMPTPKRPEKLDSDPEAAEVLAQALVGQLERDADADLYLGRDLRRAMDTVSRLALQGCAVASEERAEVLNVTAVYFEDSLEAPLSIMAAEPAERIEDALDDLRAAKGDEAGACEDVATAFADARKALFP